MSPRDIARLSLINMHILLTRHTENTYLAFITNQLEPCPLPNGNLRLHRGECVVLCTPSKLSLTPLHVDAMAPAQPSFALWVAGPQAPKLCISATIHSPRLVTRALMFPEHLHSRQHSFDTIIWGLAERTTNGIGGEYYRKIAVTPTSLLRFHPQPRLCRWPGP